MIVMEFRKRHGKLSRPTYSRLMVMISTFDIVTSFSLMMGKLMVPRGDGYVDGYGTTGTCTLQSYLVSIGIGSIALYNACLMIYFVLAVRYGITERVIGRKYEPMMHAIFVVVVLLWTIFGLVWKVFNPKITIVDKNVTTLSYHYHDWVLGHGSNISNEDMGIIIPFCSIDAYPSLCADTTINNFTLTGIECERGVDEKDDLYFVSCILFVMVCWMIIVLALLLLYMKVRSQEVANRRYEFGRRSSSSATTTTNNTRSTRFFKRRASTSTISTTAAPSASSIPTGLTTSTLNATLPTQQPRSRQQQHQKRNRRRKLLLSNRVAIQAILYGIFFVNAYLWIVLSAYLENDLIAEIVVIIFNTSQGTMNCGVYMKPYLERFKRDSKGNA